MSEKTELLEARLSIVEAMLLGLIKASISDKDPSTIANMLSLMAKPEEPADSPMNQAVAHMKTLIQESTVV